jgi:hypothetical protein
MVCLWSGSLYTGSYHASSLFSRLSAVWQVEGRQPNSRACGKRAGERIRRRRPNTVVIDRASRAHALHCVPRHGPSLTMAYPPTPSCPGTASQWASQSHLTPRSAVGVARKTDAWRQHQRARVRWGAVEKSLYGFMLLYWPTPFGQKVHLFCSFHLQNEITEATGPLTKDDLGSDNSDPIM